MIGGGRWGERDFSSKIPSITGRRKSTNEKE